MMKGFSSIVTGLILLITGFYYFIFFSNPLSGLFMVLFGSFGLMILITGIFQNRNKNDKKTYFFIMVVILSAMLLFSTLQLLGQRFDFIVTGIALILVFTCGSIYFIHKLHPLIPKIGQVSKPSDYILPLPDNYKKIFLIGYLSAILFTIAIFAVLYSKIVYGSLNGNNIVILIPFALIFYLYFNYKIKFNMVRGNRMIQTKYILINSPLTILIAINFFIFY